MARDIKFRAWDGINKVMEYTFIKTVVCEDGTEYFFEAIRVLGRNKVMSLHEISLTNKYKLMQFTGLLDKNGKGEYEGDFVQETYEDLARNGETCKSCIQQIVWIKEQACFGLIPSYPYDFSPLQYHNKREIIGNIYENPELLKETI